MGGRGSGGIGRLARGVNGPGKNFAVFDSDGNETGTITVSRGRAYFESGSSGTITELPGSPKEAINRISGNGGTVKTLSGKEVKQREAAKKAGREQTNRELDRAYTSDRHFVKGSRANRTGNRAARK